MFKKTIQYEGWCMNPWDTGWNYHSKTVKLFIFGILVFTEIESKLK